MKRPLVGLAAVYAAGIYAGSLVHWPVLFFLVAAAAFLVAFGVCSQTRYSRVVLLAAVFFAGAFALREVDVPAASTPIAQSIGMRDQNAYVRGVIVTDPIYETGEDRHRDAAAKNRCRFELKVTALNWTGDWRPVPGKLLVVADRIGEPAPLRYGDALECYALLRVPRGPTNPGTFDWPTWLARHGMVFTASIRSANDCAVVARDRGNPVRALSLRLRGRFERALHYGLEDEPALAGVLTAMVIGERSEIPADTHADFQQTGVFHVFAIAGLHVGIVTALVMIALGLVRIPARWCGLVAIPLLVLYVFATGARPGAVRALVMACVWLVGRMLVRPGDLLNGLAAAALLLLAADPWQAFDGGFAMSFLAVGGLAVLTLRIERLLGRWTNPDPMLPARLRNRWIAAAERPARRLVRLVSASVAVWLGLLPVMAYQFHLFTPISILANVIVVPLLGTIISLGMLAMLAHGIWPWLALILNNANFLFLAGMVRAVDWMSRVPGGHWFVQAPPLWVMAMYYGGGLLLLSRRLSRRYKLWLGAAILGVAAAAPFLRQLGDRSLELTVLDLRNRESIFLNAPGTQHDWLIDGGDGGSARPVVLEYLRGQGVDRLGAMVLTRGDKDHAEGLVAIARQIPVGGALHAAGPTGSASYRQWLKEMQDRSVPLRAWRAGETIALGRHIRVRALYPPADRRSSRNADSVLVWMLEYGPTRVLLASDAGADVQKSLLRSGADLRADVLIQGPPENGAPDPSEFLEAVRPRAVVITGEGPMKACCLERDLAEWPARHGARLYRTADQGAVTVRLTDRGYAIRTCRESR